MALETITKSLYESDYLLWLETTLEQVRKRRVNEIDWENLAEELDSLGIALHHKVDSYLRVTIQGGDEINRVSAPWK